MNFLGALLAAILEILFECWLWDWDSNTRRTNFFLGSPVHRGGRRRRLAFAAIAVVLVGVLVALLLGALIN
jgi:hypothetical protein